MNDTFRYFTGHLKSIIRLLLVYVIPLFAVSMTAAAIYSGPGSILNKMAFMLYNFRESDPVQVALVIIPFFGGVVFHNLVFNKHMLANESRASLPGNFADYKNWIASDFKLHTANVFFLLLIIISVTFTLLLFLAGPLAPELRVSFGTDPLYFLLQNLPWIMFIFVILPVTSFISVSALFYSFREKTGILPAIQKTWSYMRENFFRAWGFSILALLLVWMMMLVCKIPLFLIGQLIAFSFPNAVDAWINIYMLLHYVYLAFTYLFIAGFFQVLCIFQFASFEEQKEGVVMQEKISQI